LNSDRIERQPGNLDLERAQRLLGLQPYLGFVDTETAEGNRRNAGEIELPLAVELVRIAVRQPLLKLQRIGCVGLARRIRLFVARLELDDERIPPAETRRALLARRCLAAL